MTIGLLDMINTPTQANLVPSGADWCADNGCYGKGYVGDGKWVAWLDSYPAEVRERCAFAVAPDVVGDAAATLTRSVPWLPAIRALGYRAAFVAQDGQEALPVPWGELDVLFIGGTTDWKIGPAARSLVEQAILQGKTVHMGRVNTKSRLRYANSIGCDSADGTFLTFGPDVNLKVLLRWLLEIIQEEAV